MLYIKERHRNNMKNIATLALFFLAAGIFTSLTILSAYQVLIPIPLAYYTFQAFKHSKVKLPPSAFFLLAFTAVALSSLLLNLELVPAPLKNFGRIKDYLYGILGILLCHAWLNEATDTVKKNIVRTFLLSIIVAGLYAAWEILFIGKERIDGLTHRMRYGYGTAMILLTLLSAILHRKNIRNWFDSKLGIAALAIGLIGMYFSFSRGALLGFMCGLPFALYFYRPRLGLTLGGLALLGVLGLSGVYLFGSGQYGSRYLVNKDNQSDVIRRSQWKAAVIATKEKPILGWGLSNFHSQLKRIKNDYNLDAKDYDDAHSHNLFLEVSSGTGLVGLFCFLGWLFSWARESFRSGQINRALIIPFGVAFIVSSQFEVTFDANNASMIFFLYALSSAHTLKAS